MLSKLSLVIFVALLSSQAWTCDEHFVHEAFLPAINEEQVVFNLNQVPQKNILGESLNQAQAQGSRFVIFSNGTAAEGTLANVFFGLDNTPAYLGFNSQTRLMVSGAKSGSWKQLKGQGFAQHAQGFGMPVGSPFADDISLFTKKDWHSKGIIEGQMVTLQYPSGVVVKGVLEAFQTDAQGIVRVLKFANNSTEVRFGNQILFAKDWGVYDLLVGSKVSNAMLLPK